MKENMANRESLYISPYSNRSKDFTPYVEEFRPLNEEEAKAVSRSLSFIANGPVSDYQVSYQCIIGGFTICNILHQSNLYTGASHCVKWDRWLPIRGKMIAFRRALEHSQGVNLGRLL